MSSSCLYMGGGSQQPCKLSKARQRGQLQWGVPGEGLVLIPMATGGCEPTPQGRCRRHWQQLSRVICLNKCYESAREEEVRCRRQRLLGIFSQTNARIRAKKKGAISSVFDDSYHRSILYVINSSKEKEREREVAKTWGEIRSKHRYPTKRASCTPGVPQAPAPSDAPVPPGVCKWT